MKMDFLEWFLILLFNLELFKTNPIQSCVNLDGGETCHTKDPNPYRNYGTKTAYRVAIDDKNVPDVRGCSPKVFYMLSRHATRYPDEEYIEYINKHLPLLKERIVNSSVKGKVGNLCKEDIDRLKSWTPSMQTKDDNKISVTGEREAEKLGERYRKRFPSILGLRYSPEVFSIEYTSKKRTKVTAKNFARGLFTEQDYEKIDFKGDNDKLLQFHKECKKIKKECENDDDTREVEKFKNGTLMTKVVSSVSKRIGFDVSNVDVKHMYVACIFGYALNISDAWCSVFSTDDLKVLEYNADIDDYYKDSYGNEINAKQACPVVKYIVDLFKFYEERKRSKVALHFSHSGALKKVYAAFGLFRDDRPLTADDFCALNSRKWRSSHVSPFNTNIVFVLYQCGEEYKVMTLHNENPVVIDGCDSVLCPLQKFKEKYKPVSQDCDIKRICNICSEN